MNEIKKYAEEWNISASYFYENNYYSWMADTLSEYSTILEVGCGTGYSTLALAKKGFNVIAVDKNIDCITKAKELLFSKGINDKQVIFIEVM